MGRSNIFDLVSIFFYRVSDTGIAYGQLDPTATETGDTISNALGFIGEGIEATLPEVTYKRVTFGGSRQLGTAWMGTEPLGEFTITLASTDSALYTMFKDSTIDTTTIAGATLYSPNNNLQAPNQVGVIFSSQRQSRDAGSNGANKYRTYVVPLAQGFVNESALNVSAGENPQPVTITLTPQMANKHPWGTAFGSNENFAGNQVDHYYIDYDYPYGLTTWIADGVETTFEAEFIPAESTVTNGNDGNVTSVNGVVTALSSIATATAQATVSVAGSDGDNWTWMYPLAVPITAV